MHDSTRCVETWFHYGARRDNISGFDGRPGGYEDPVDPTIWLREHIGDTDDDNLSS
ncbi:MAG: hypothetical protein H0U28_12710 [Nocardioidaceae bacterium]|nr:hypothetical protein [Nocardioidaceae bacterium]